MRALAYIGFIVTIAIVLITLAGCAGPPVPIVPASLLTCADQPKSPADVPGTTQRDVAPYVVDLAVAGADCRRNLGSVRRILSPENSN